MRVSEASRLLVSASSHAAKMISRAMWPSYLLTWPFSGIQVASGCLGELVTIAHGSSGYLILRMGKVLPVSPPASQSAIVFDWPLAISQSLGQSFTTEGKEAWLENLLAQESQTFPPIGHG